MIQIDGSSLVHGAWLSLWCLPSKAPWSVCGLGPPLKKVVCNIIFLLDEGPLTWFVVSGPHVGFAGLLIVEKKVCS